MPPVPSTESMEENIREHHPDATSPNRGPWPFHHTRLPPEDRGLTS